MDLARARFIVSPAARDALDGLPAEAAELPLHQLAALLRRDFPAAEAAALAEQLLLRARARARFGHLPFRCFTPAGLEMMTHPAVAARRADRLRALDLPAVDLTCGIGGDLSMLAAARIAAAGVEREAVTAVIASANVPVAPVARGDAGRPPFRLERRAVLIDPARREGHRRRWDPGAFQPDWQTAVAAARAGRAGVLKAPPGIDHAQIPPDAEAEFIQLGRSMREAALWFGAGSEPGLRRAVLLPAGVELCSTDPEGEAAPAPIRSFVFDPESCVTRAGLVRHLARRLGARLLDEHVAYLSGGEGALDPMCATFEVLESLPFSVARLRERLRRAAWCPREIRRRAFPIEPDDLRRLLGRIEGEPVTLLCTTIAGRRTVIVGRRVTAAAAESS